VKKSVWMDYADFICAVLVFTISQLNKPSSDVTVGRSELRLAAVQKSDLPFIISSFDKLLSKHKDLLTAPAIFRFPSK
jgi:HlyD family secretion protein